jgi:choline-sulfatase
MSKRRRSVEERRKPAASAGGRWRRWPVAVVLVVVVSVVFFTGWRVLRSSPPGRAASRHDPLNVLLVTLDTTRADRLGAYGYARARTPRLDRLAAEGVRFDRVTSPAPITLPAHASILTGLYPFHHGVRNNGNFYLADRFATIATVLKAKGYRTAAFVSSFVLDRRYGLARGFDTYDDRMEGAGPRVLELGAERRGDRTSLAFLSWLDRYAAAPAGTPPAAGTATPVAPFFAWLHLYDPHEPYHAPPPFGTAFADSPYDGEIAFDDAIVASVLDKLRALGMLDRTLIAVIGDHGESLGDHGEDTHTMFVYESAVRVPLILWRPGVVPSGIVVQRVVRATDLAPTLLDLAGAPPLAGIDGTSLVSAVNGGAPADPPPAYAETLLPQLYMNWAPLRAVRDGRWKLIDAPRPELYDLQSDPGERQNRYDDRRQTADLLRRQLDQMTSGQRGGMTVVRMDREALDRLAALGYVGAGAEPADGPAPAGSTDPKDMIAVFNELRRANAAVRDRRFVDALPILRKVLAADPRNAFARLVFASALMGQGEYRAAIDAYREYLGLVPASSYAHQWIAICELRAGDRDAAIREADAALAIDPRFSDARILKAGVLAGRGQYDLALAELATAVKDDPAKPTIRLDYARVLEEAGRPDDAASQFGAALELEPGSAAALAGLGALYARQGRLDAAGGALKRALAMHPEADEARFNLAKVYERQRDEAAARVEYRRLVEGPETTPAVRAAARERLAALAAGRR